MTHDDPNPLTLTLNWISFILFISTYIYFFSQSSLIFFLFTVSPFKSKIIAAFCTVADHWDSQSQDPVDESQLFQLPILSRSAGSVSDSSVSVL